MRLPTPLALALVSCAAAAQPADTLDWRRYYPLAVGNVWEYHGAEARGSLTRVALLADTVAGGRTYFRRRTEKAAYVGSLDGPLTPVSTAFDFVRYDGGGGVVAVVSVDGDGAAVEPCADDVFERDLRLGFGTRRACDPPTDAEADSVVVEGEYHATWAPEPIRGPAAPVAVAAVKRYTVGCCIWTAFVADVGPVRAGNLSGPELHYALVGGVEYGAAEFPTAGEPGAPRRSALEVRTLGNPVRGRLAFRVRDASPHRAVAVVHDALGREVLSAVVAVATDWRLVELPSSGLPSGRYVLSVSGPAGRSTTPFTLAR